MTDSEIQLAEMIQLLREELALAESKGKDSDLAFEVQGVELELKVAITKSKNVKTGVKFWVLNAGGEVEKSNATTHIFKLTLNPKSRHDGSTIDVSHEDDVAPGKASKE